jgi:CHAT domain-containing protein
MADSSVDLLAGAEATPAAYLARPAERYTWLHFAAHAQAVSGNPLDSAVVLSPGPDGIKLYARDILDHGTSASLVTLSACRGAGTRLFSGEGLVGFAWAFMRAGSNRVIAGLWDVSDSSTVVLMKGLYGSLARGDAPDAALREAKLRLSRSSSNLSKPFYWAPFQLYTRTVE